MYRFNLGNLYLLSFILRTENMAPHIQKKNSCLLQWGEILICFKCVRGTHFVWNGINKVCSILTSILYPYMQEKFRSLCSLFQSYKLSF